MKVFKVIFISFLFINLFSITSCIYDDDDIDIRDQYVGTWKFNINGSLTVYHNSESSTSPINHSGTTTISKSGKNHLIIEGKEYLVDGTHLSSNPESINETSSGVNFVGTATENGILGDGVITINSSIKGTWNGGGVSGTFSGSSKTTLTKE